jgi:Tfp pilus assembly pilus retraction ATPase PilT
MEIGMKDDMQTLGNALADLVRRNVVTREDALQVSSNREQLLKLLNRQNLAAVV